VEGSKPQPALQREVPRTVDGTVHAEPAEADVELDPEAIAVLRDRAAADAITRSVTRPPSFS
jgi:hypothetical protein